VNQEIPESPPQEQTPEEPTPQEQVVDAMYESNLHKRHRYGKVWRFLFQASTIIGILALIALMINIINSAFGYVAFEAKKPPETLTDAGVVLSELPKEELVIILQENISKNLFRRFVNDMPMSERTKDDILTLIYEEVVEPTVVEQWTLIDSITNKEDINQTMAERYPDADLEFMSWIDRSFITSPQSSDALYAGVRTAILGSLWVVGIAILFSFPIGVGGAIYLQEYATDTWINRVIQTNINNLSGVPSIIYGILGLAIFVRALEPLTSGAIFGLADPTTANGRTVLSAGLTLGLLVLPMIIINSQEAIKAVPDSLRQAGLGLGATKWQTIWSHVLPNAMPGILTGTILSMSRAIGETAPLVVIGASTFITVDPTSPFSKFTTLPIQIFQWTSRPQDVFRNIAAAAIIVLLILLLTLNATAIILRNKYKKY
jgi:phosphate transport system permease protein